MTELGEASGLGALCSGFLVAFGCQILGKQKIIKSLIKLIGIYFERKTLENLWKLNFLCFIEPKFVINLNKIAIFMENS